MTPRQQDQLRSVLQTLAHISYTTLIEVRKEKGVDEKQIENLERFKETLEESILKIFEE